MPINSLKLGPNLSKLTEAQLEQWPQHDAAIKKAFEGMSHEQLQFAERIAKAILLLSAGTVKKLCQDYRWTCEVLREEEYFFRKQGRYRLQSFAEAEQLVYADPSFMKPYLNGLLLSQVFWRNQLLALSAFDSFCNEPNTSSSRPSFLEIGPGHGLLIWLAAQSKKFSSLSAWDVSCSSVEATRSALAKLSVEGVSLESGDVNAQASDQKFDCIVLSEVLEHLEDPLSTLRKVVSMLLPQGRVFINVPINSPAPDHVFLLQSPEEAKQLVVSSGLEVLSEGYFPMAGYSLEQAEKKKATVSCVFVAEQRG